MRYTLIMIPETARASVRKVQIRRAWLRVLGGLAVAFVACSALLTHQYLRLRRELVDLPRLRAERAQQGEQLRRYSEQFSQIEGELGRVREFERKLRVISNLPASIAEVAPGSVQTGSSGLGGALEDSTAQPVIEDRPASTAPPSLSAEGARSGGESGPPANAGDASDLPPGAPMDAGPAGGAAPQTSGQAAPAGAGDPLAGVDWEALQRAAQRLALQLTAQHASLARLDLDLASKVERLASTPSIWPTRGWLTSRFGRRISPFTGRVQVHPGLDIACEPGTPIVAPARGRVTFVGERGPLGKTVILDHGFGIETTYGHARELLVQPGQRVERGQRIALVGSTGRSTGPHLHYGLEINGRLVDPVDYILD
jgi:murein DD-endopeptidase MepM/ murein hydrolase activator NlpD